jgi:hypothetical protein
MYCRHCNGPLTYVNVWGTVFAWLCLSKACKEQLWPRAARSAAGEEQRSERD